jgi:hypothetical protein
MYYALRNQGVLTTVIERFEKQQLPRAFSIKDAVDHGQKLSDLNISFMKEVLRESEQFRHFADDNPEYRELFSRSIHLYSSIIKQALANEHLLPRLN